MSGVYHEKSQPLSTGQTVPFADRHIGISPDEQAKMLAAIGYESLDDLVAAALPPDIRHYQPLEIPAAASEPQVAAELRDIAGRNQVLTSMIGLGYYGTITPPVIRRNVLENPAWYTAYTPYQAEISQGRLEALLNFQTVISDLTGLPVANASLLDEATAAAEAMVLCARVTSRDVFVVDADCFPQTIDVLKNRADALNIDVVVCDTAAGLPPGDLCGVLLQFPGSSGRVADHSVVIEQAHERGALAVVAADLLALTLFRPPGDMGADIAVGSSQRFGMPMGFGGPHAAYFAVRSDLQRNLPGRLVGISRDAAGAPAYRLALQTREQHIRRAKATSNVCTAQVLPAVVAAMYAIWHGREGLTNIAARVHYFAHALAAGVQAAGLKIEHQHFFDTVLIDTPGQADAVVANALRGGINLRRVDADHVAVACDETTSPADIAVVWQACGIADDVVQTLQRKLEQTDFAAPASLPLSIPTELQRSSAFLTHPVFQEHRTETAMLRYLRRLSDRDLALDRTMIPLGSCTMKLNATTEMEPITWPGFANLHPFAPLDQAAGYRQLCDELGDWLGRITGFDAVSLQPTAGSQGELAGLFAIRAYHRARSEENRTICLIPESAHGTNPASATLAGMQVVAVACQPNGDVDLENLRATLAKHVGNVAALMITYPSTNGIFETQISQICELVHDAGGQVYADGANLNAMVGLARPGDFGADICHVNLHKTFCIPHGGGGPGVGPVCAKAHLAPYLPSHRLFNNDDQSNAVGPVSAAPWGSASILPVSWAYIRLMGPDGLRRASQCAILAANYVAWRLGSYYPVLFSGQNGLVAHECIVDLRPLSAATGINAEDVAKRLIDYGFHAPTMSFPVAGTLMIEPTESENLAELDRFCRAMIAIRGEIDAVAAGEFEAIDNPLKNGPHTAAMLTTNWPHPYSREQAVFPIAEVAEDKYWPPVRRVDNAYGDRHLVCSCPPVSSYEQVTV